MEHNSNTLPSNISPNFSVERQQISNSRPGHNFNNDNNNHSQYGEKDAAAKSTEKQKRGGFSFSRPFNLKFKLRGDNKSSKSRAVKPASSDSKLFGKLGKRCKSNLELSSLTERERESLYRSPANHDQSFKTTIVNRDGQMVIHTIKDEQCIISDSDQGASLDYIDINITSTSSRELVSKVNDNNDNFKTSSLRLQSPHQNRLHREENITGIETDCQKDPLESSKAHTLSRTSIIPSEYSEEVGSQDFQQMLQHRKYDSSSRRHSLCSVGGENPSDVVASQSRVPCEKPQQNTNEKYIMLMSSTPARNKRALLRTNRAASVDSSLPPMAVPPSQSKRDAERRNLILVEQDMGRRNHVHDEYSEDCLNKKDSIMQGNTNINTHLYEHQNAVNTKNQSRMEYKQLSTFNTIRAAKIGEAPPRTTRKHDVSQNDSSGDISYLVSIKCNEANSTANKSKLQPESDVSTRTLPSAFREKNSGEQIAPRYKNSPSAPQKPVRNSVVKKVVGKANQEYIQTREATTELLQNQQPNDEYLYSLRANKEHFRTHRQNLQHLSVQNSKIEYDEIQQRQKRGAQKISYEYMQPLKLNPEYLQTTKTIPISSQTRKPNNEYPHTRTQECDNLQPQNLCTEALPIQNPNSEYLHIPKPRIKHGLPQNEGKILQSSVLSSSDIKFEKCQPRIRREFQRQDVSDLAHSCANISNNITYSLYDTNYVAVKNNAYKVNNEIMATCQTSSNSVLQFKREQSIEHELEYPHNFSAHTPPLLPKTNIRNKIASDDSFPIANNDDVANKLISDNLIWSREEKSEIYLQKGTEKETLSPMVQCDNLNNRVQNTTQEHRSSFRRKPSGNIKDCVSYQMFESMSSASSKDRLATTEITKVKTISQESVVSSAGIAILSDKCHHSTMEQKQVCEVKTCRNSSYATDYEDNFNTSPSSEGKHSNKVSDTVNLPEYEQSTYIAHSDTCSLRSESSATNFHTSDMNYDMTSHKKKSNQKRYLPTTASCGTVAFESSPQSVINKMNHDYKNNSEDQIQGPLRKAQSESFSHTGETINDIRDKFQINPPASLPRENDRDATENSHVVRAVEVKEIIEKTHVVRSVEVNRLTASNMCYGRVIDDTVKVHNPSLEQILGNVAAKGNTISADTRSNYDDGNPDEDPVFDAHKQYEKVKNSNKERFENELSYSLKNPNIVFANSADNQLMNNSTIETLKNNKYEEEQISVSLKKSSSISYSTIDRPITRPTLHRLNSFPSANSVISRVDSQTSKEICQLGIKVQNPEPSNLSNGRTIVGTEKPKQSFMAPFKSESKKCYMQSIAYKNGSPISNNEEIVQVKREIKYPETNSCQISQASGLHIKVDTLSPAQQPVQNKQKVGKQNSLSFLNKFSWKKTPKDAPTEKSPPLRECNNKYSGTIIDPSPKPDIILSNNESAEFKIDTSSITNLRRKSLSVTDLSTGTSLLGPTKQFFKSFSDEELYHHSPLQRHKSFNQVDDKPKHPVKEAKLKPNSATTSLSSYLQLGFISYSMSKLPTLFPKSMAANINSNVNNSSLEPPENVKGATSNKRRKKNSSPKNSLNKSQSISDVSLKTSPSLRDSQNQRNIFFNTNRVNTTSTDVECPSRLKENKHVSCDISEKSTPNTNLEATVTDQNPDNLQRIILTQASGIPNNSESGEDASQISGNKHGTTVWHSTSRVYTSPFDLMIFNREKSVFYKLIDVFQSTKVNCVSSNDTTLIGNIWYYSK